MANKKYKLGKVVKSHKGYNIRKELKDIRVTEKDRFGRERVLASRKGDAGTYAVYAGKNFKSGGHKTVEIAVASIS